MVEDTTKPIINVPPDPESMDAATVNTRETRKRNREKLKETRGESSKDNIQDADGFMKPPAKKTAKAKAISKKAATVTHNGYDSLSETDDNMSVTSFNSSVTSNNQTSKNRLYRPRLNETQKIKRIKPIVVQRITNEEIQKLLQDLGCKCAYQKARNSSSYQLFPVNIDQKRSIIEKLKATQRHHFTYSETDDRHIIFVLKRLHRMEPAELLKNLNDAGIQAVRVTLLFDPMKSKSPNKEDLDASYLIFFKKNDDITFTGLAKNHTIINFMKVEWARLDSKKKKPTQCFTCQAWGHAAINCGRSRNCVKCLESHEKGACKRISTEGEPSCVNCKKVGHLASSYNCEVFIKYQQRIQSGKKQREQARSFPATRHTWVTQPPVRNDVNFPSLSSANRQHENVSNHLSSQPCPPQSSQFQMPLPGKSTQSTQNSSANSPFSLLDAFSSIEGIDETWLLFEDLIRRLKAEPNQFKRLAILGALALGRPCP